MPAACNEDLNYDPYCDPGYADNNYFSLPMYNAHPDHGHAVGTAGSTGPWQSDGNTLVSDLPNRGMNCWANSNGYYWFCG